MHKWCHYDHTKRVFQLYIQVSSLTAVTGLRRGSPRRFIINPERPQNNNNMVVGCKYSDLNEIVELDFILYIY